MFLPPEDLLFQSGPVWHGTALGWPSSINNYISKLPIVSERFCGVQYLDTVSAINILSYSVYLPTAGNDEDFTEVISLLTCDISNNRSEESTIIIGLDSNHSKKSTNRRKESMNKFLNIFSLQSIHVSDQPTFHHNNQISETQIDHILYHIPKLSKVDIKFKDIFCKLNNSSNLSSHDAVVGELSLQSGNVSVNEVDHSNKYTELISSKPKWNEAGIAGYQAQTYNLIKDMSV